MHFLIILVIVIAIVLWLLIDFDSSSKKESTVYVPVVEPIKVETKKINNNYFKWKNELKSQLYSRESVYEQCRNREIKSIKYIDLINTREWNTKRIEILLRDNYTCQDCNKYFERLEVHHNYYLADKLPWEIDNSALVTLCRTHHQARHTNITIPVYKKMNDTLVLTNVNNYYCTRCMGMGYIPHFKHVENGICFKCWGDCFDQTIFSKALSKLTFFHSNDIEQIINGISIDYFEKYIEPNLIFSEVATNDDLPF